MHQGVCAGLTGKRPRESNKLWVGSWPLPTLGKLLGPRGESCGEFPSFPHSAQDVRLL